MTELERELRGLAAAIDFPETPEIASNVRLVPRRGATHAERSWRTAVVVGGRRDRGCRRRRPGGAAGTDVRSCTCSGSARCRSSSSTGCPRSGPEPRSTLGTAIDPADAPFPLLRPDRPR